MKDIDAIQEELFEKFFRGKYVLAIIDGWDPAVHPKSSPEFMDALAVLPNAFYSALLEFIREYDEDEDEKKLRKKIRLTQQRAEKLRKQEPEWFVHPLKRAEIDMSFIEEVDQYREAGDENSANDVMKETAANLAGPLFYAVGLMDHLSDVPTYLLEK